MPTGRACPEAVLEGSPAGRLAEHADHGLATETRARTVDHLDAADEAALAAQIDRQIVSLADQPVDAEVLAQSR